MNEQQPAAPVSSTPDSTSTLTAEAPTAVARRRSGSKWLVIGAIAVVVVLAILYVVGGAAMAAGPIGNADKALRNTVDHENSVVDVLNTDPLKGIDLSGSNFDVAKAKAALTTYKQKLSSVEPTVSGDRQALQSVLPNLQNSVLTLPEQGSIGQHRTRVDAALAALHSAQRGIDISRKQVDFLNALFDAAASFDALGKSMQANDLNGSASQLTTTGATVKKTIALAQPPDVPTAFMPMLQAMQKATNDLQGLIQAVQNNDNAGAQKYVAAVEADGNALQSVDQNAIDKAENDLFNPLMDSYNHEMKIAAG